MARRIIVCAEYDGKNAYAHQNRQIDALAAKRSLEVDKRGMPNGGEKKFAKRITILDDNQALLQAKGKITCTKEKSCKKEFVSPVLPSEGFVRLPVVLAVLGLGQTTFLTGVREGKFPKPIRLAPRAVAWRVEDIRMVIAKISAQ